jgi:hypothetical protein
MSAMPKQPAGEPALPADESPKPLRAQILAIEYGSLLASRTTTQNEVLSRIGIFLTLVSATLVSLALVGQATKFGSVFPVFAIAIIAFATIVGVLTQVRVINVSMEDLGFVLAMNRLRAEFVALAPEVEAALMTSTHDDRAGVFTTYYFLGNRRSQVLGSSMVFIIAINSALVGLLGAAIVMTAGAVFAGALVAGFACGVVFCVVSMVVGSRPFFVFWKSYVPRNSSP